MTAPITPHIDHLNELMARPDSCPTPTMPMLVKLAHLTIGLSEANYLAWQNRFLGQSGYIDGIKASMLGDKELMWGYDPHGRIFIVFQYNITTTDGEGIKQAPRPFTFIKQ